jgi:hypothetical protein
VRKRAHDAAAAIIVFTKISSSLITSRAAACTDTGHRVAEAWARRRRVRSATRCPAGIGRPDHGWAAHHPAVPRRHGRPRRDGDIDWSLDPYHHPSWSVSYRGGGWIEALIDAYLAGGPTLRRTGTARRLSCAIGCAMFLSRIVSRAPSSAPTTRSAG